MFSLKGCSIHLDQTQKKYVPGQIMNGTVLIQFNEPAKMRGLKIEFVGAAHVSWTERKTYRSNGKSRSKTVRYYADENYFNQESYLIGNKDQEAFTLPVGQHTYPFTYTVPHNLPSSFEGKHGHIRYTLTITMDRPWKIDKSTYILFEVIPINTNIDRSMNLPQNIEMEKTFCCLCCTSGPLKVHVRIPNDTFSPGKKIPFHIDCENGSNVKVKNIVIQLNKIIIFHSRHPSHKTKTQTIAICETSVGSVSVNSSRTIINELEIPFIELFELKPCNIINLMYELRFEFEVAGTHSNLVANIALKLVNTDYENFAPPPPYNGIQTSDMPQLQPYPPEKGDIYMKSPNVAPYNTQQHNISPSAPPQY